MLVGKGSIARSGNCQGFGRTSGFPGNAGRTNWLALDRPDAGGHFRLKPLGVDLYSGLVGVGLFLAAVCRTASNEFAPLVWAIVRSVRDVFSDTARGTAELKRIGIGGVAGTTSVAYGLARISQFMGSPEIFTDACGIAEFVTLTSIRADQKFDILSGSAGTILALASLQEIQPSAPLLDKIIACGNRIVEDYLPCLAASGQSDRRPLTGFSHGSGGIAYAMLRLFELTGDEAYRRAALQALSYENEQFDRSAGNWPDYRLGPGQSRRFQNSWCHGAAGIVLGRLGSLRIAPTACGEEFETALNTTATLARQGVDQLCCGNMGRIDVLLEAGRRLNRPELRAAADHLMNDLLQAADDRGGFQLLHNLPRSAFTPGLFRGLAGLGYGLLRSTDVDSIPCVLLLE